MKRTVIGILAHVDAGKTTLSEAMLYCSGSIRTFGRVDHGNAYLDTFALERQRGITIFSKQAVLQLPELRITLLDTPGHVDFSAEMERTLDVLDCAILVISATAGIQSHTLTVWELLRQRKIPTLLFVNKMDLPGADRAQVLADLHKNLGDGVMDVLAPDLEEAAMCDEALLEEYLDSGTLAEASLIAASARCALFPCWFGAALKLEGVEEFLDGLSRYAPAGPAGNDFGAMVFKVSRDDQGTRLTHLKVTGGVLRVRDTLSGSDWAEKVTQLRVYSGAKYTPVEEALPGDVVAVVGLSRTTAGLGLGSEAHGAPPTLSPVLTYNVQLPALSDIHTALSQFRQLEEEQPELHVDFDQRTQQLQVQLMGPVQLEILQQQLLDRFGLSVTFDQGAILYRETIADTVEGVGHYEPLRHYAEVHLLLEPGQRGSGIHLSSACSEDELDRNWQRLILTHLMEKQHLGVLTGSPITDVSITLVAGKAHLKHTEGGDFRQATYRAVRQGLMQAKSVLLEPWYSFRLEVPQSGVGRAMTDLQRMNAELDPPVTLGETTVLTGAVSVAALGDYSREVAAYTKGLGRFTCTVKGYSPCADQDAVVRAIGYQPESDLDNTPDSVFCSHGAGTVVKWDQVPAHMHLPSVLKPVKEPDPWQIQAERYVRMAATDKELMAIFERTYGPIQRDKKTAMRPASSAASKPYRGVPQLPGPEYVLVDGYNIIFAWNELKAIAETDLDQARQRLVDILRNYQAFRSCPVILVFDAYKVKNNPGSVETLGGLSIVYTKEAETADMYIEKVTHELGRKHQVRVATSDGLEQMIILSHGALRVSASNFYEEVQMVDRSIAEFLSGQVQS